jgi:hypothetical protein
MILLMNAAVRCDLIQWIDALQLNYSVGRIKSSIKWYEF